MFSFWLMRSSQSVFVCVCVREEQEAWERRGGVLSQKMHSDSLSASASPQLMRSENLWLCESDAIRY